VNMYLSVTGDAVLVSAKSIAEDVADGVDRHFSAPTPDSARRRLRDCACSMTCIIHTKQ
jgi:hypothetical protein